MKLADLVVGKLYSPGFEQHVYLSRRFETIKISPPSAFLYLGDSQVLVGTDIWFISSYEMKYLKRVK